MVTKIKVNGTGKASKEFNSSFIMALERIHTHTEWMGMASLQYFTMTIDIVNKHSLCFSSSAGFVIVSSGYRMAFSRSTSSRIKQERL